ncbi:threonylcarbamoyl-AMP synthase [bacterium]|nr:threonylcarbamoyl-AMP synthase [bacterium]
MPEHFKIHPEHPQHRLVAKSVEILRGGGVIAYPTDSGYALGCHIGDKSALERIIDIRRIDERHNFTLVCRDLSEISLYARFDTPVFRILRAHTPGPYTFILNATREVPRRLLNPKRKTIGIRIPDHKIVQALLAELNEPIMSTTLILPGQTDPLNDADEIREALKNHVDLVIDGGRGEKEATTVVDLSGERFLLLRRGRGDASPFLA